MFPFKSIRLHLVLLLIRFIGLSLESIINRDSLNSSTKKSLAYT